jgi:hypothetical protein
MTLKKEIDLCNIFKSPKKKYFFVNDSTLVGFKKPKILFRQLPIIKKPGFKISKVLVSKNPVMSADSFYKTKLFETGFSEGRHN